MELVNCDLSNVIQEYLSLSRSITFLKAFDKSVEPFSRAI